MPLSMDCASGVSEARRRQIESEMADALIGDLVNLDLATICPHWPVPDLGDDLLIGSPQIAETMVQFLRDGTVATERIEMPSL